MYGAPYTYSFMRKKFICVKIGYHSTVLVTHFTVHLDHKTPSCHGNYDGNNKCD